MDEITFSMDYRYAWRKARQIKNIDAMEQIFNDLCSEVGLRDETAESAQAEAGRARAEYMNNRGRGPEVKKL